MPPKREIAPCANASLILGCAGIISPIAVVAFGSPIFGLGILASIPAVLCGHIARGEIRRSEASLAGNRRAFAGLFTGYVVIAVVGIAILLLPRLARKISAESHVKNIAAATKQYYAEYGKYPIGYEGQEKSTRDLTLGATNHNSLLFNTLRSIPEGANRADRLNPRKIEFFDGPNVSDPSHPTSGFAEIGLVDPQTKGSYFDPWGDEYLIRIHYDSTKPFIAPDGTRVEGNVIVWSLGPDGLQGTKDDIVSWK